MKTLHVILILLIIATGASGQQWHWEHNDDLLNPNHIFTRGMNCPFTGDFDRDGDIDLIVGCRGGVLQYYENIGTPDSAIWQINEDYFSSLDLDTSYAPQPSLVDLDGDGVEELYIQPQDEYGMALDSLQRFLNTGTPENPCWERVDFNVGWESNELCSSQFFDWDQDSDLDLAAINPGNGNIYYYENIGDSNNYYFAPNQLIFAEYEPEFGPRYNFRMYDINNDGELDLLSLVGVWDVPEMGLYYYTNIGTNQNPIWQAHDIYHSFWYPAQISFCNLDGDLDIDLLVGCELVALYLNEIIIDNAEWDFYNEYMGSPIGPFQIYESDNICLFDYDRDGDYDLTYFCLEYWDPIEIWQSWGARANIGSAAMPIFRGGNFLPRFIGYPRYSHLTAGDLNGDNYPDIVFNFSPLEVFYNTGPGFTWDYDTLAIPDGDIYFQCPELGDFNGDGLTDLLVKNDETGYFKCFQNVGTPDSAAWLDRPDWVENIDSGYFSFRTADLNRDGKCDLVGTTTARHLMGLINIGDSAYVLFEPAPEVFEEWSEYSITYFDCADIDGDGDDDIINNNSEVIEIIQNESTVDVEEGDVSLPQDISLLQNYPNPFNSSTNISFTLDKQCEVELAVYDILGRKVETLMSGRLPAGDYKKTWQPKADLPSGIYLCKLKAGNITATNKIVMIK